MKFWDDIAKLWALAWPVMLVHLVTIGISVTDVAMVARYNTHELAYLGIARLFYWFGVTVGAGLLAGLNVFPARAEGADKRHECGDIWRQGALYALGLGLLIMSVELAFAKPVLAAFGYPEDMVNEGADYLHITALGIPYYLWMTASFLFMEGISRPRPGMVIMLSILPINVGLNAVLIPGLFGLPAMGASGAGLATILAQAIGASAMFFYLRRMKGRDSYGLSSLKLWPIAPIWKRGRALRRFGYAPGFAGAMEFLGWLVLNQISGYFGHAAVGAMQILISLHAISFATVMGIASATSVRVGNAFGRRDPLAISRVTLRALAMMVMALTPFVLIYVFAAPWALLPFDAEADVVAITSLMMAGWAPFLFCDGMQFVLLFSLRASGDEKWASILQITAFLLVMASVGLLAAFTFGLGVRGLVVGMAAGMSAAAILLGVRFFMVRRRLPQKLQASVA